MRVNGKEIPLDGTMTLEEFLKTQNYDGNRIAVELNRKIIPRDKYSQIKLSEADTLEVVSFVGGG
jgi:sulfur carrier protein